MFKIKKKKKIDKKLFHLYYKNFIMEGKKIRENNEKI